MAGRPVGRAIVREEDVRALLASDPARTQLPSLLRNRIGEPRVRAG